jgi:hypothetical protein
MAMSYTNPIEHCPHKTAPHRSFYGNPRIRRGSGQEHQLEKHGQGQSLRKSL